MPHLLRRHPRLHVDLYALMHDGAGRPRGLRAVAHEAHHAGCDALRRGARSALRTSVPTMLRTSCAEWSVSQLGIALAPCTARAVPPRRRVMNSGGYLAVVFVALIFAMMVYM